MKSYGQEFLWAVTSRSEVDILWSGFRVSELVMWSMVDYVGFGWIGICWLWVR